MEKGNKTVLHLGKGMATLGVGLRIVANLLYGSNGNVFFPHESIKRLGLIIFIYKV